MQNVSTAQYHSEARDLIIQTEEAIQNWSTREGITEEQRCRGCVREVLAYARYMEWRKSH